MKRNKKRLACILVLCLLVVGIGYWKYMNPGSPYHLEVIRTQDDGYGYKICEGKRTLIVQPFIPVIAGKRSFRTSDDAERIGNVVLGRIETGEDFSISRKDLEQLKISLSD